MMDQWGLDSLEHLTWEDIQHYSSYPSLFTISGGSPMEEDYSAAHPIEIRPKSSSWDSSSSCTDDKKPAATILSFGNPDGRSQPSEAPKSAGCRKRTRGATAAPAAHEARRPSGVAGSARPPSHTQLDHVLAERKRRENLTRKFIALSAILPGLKKMDKASVLEDAVKYLNQLQERVKKLEGQAAKRAEDSTFIVAKKTHILSTSSDDENSEDQNLNEIEVRLSEKSVLVKIHCGDGKGVLVKALSEIEKLSLSVTSTSVVPFAASLLDITVIAQIEEGFSTTAKDLVKNLNSALRS